jgi:hypothetical protein
MKSSFMGNEDFAMSDLMTSEFDLQYASRNFKFGLVPKVSSLRRLFTNIPNFNSYVVEDLV